MEEEGMTNGECRMTRRKVDRAMTGHAAFAAIFKHRAAERSIHPKD
jgi:hypothetical protein